jgi:hypothetical protein
MAKSALMYAYPGHHYVRSKLHLAAYRCKRPGHRGACARDRRHGDDEENATHEVPEDE